MKHFRNSKRGFTLVELLLAMAIITIIGWTTVALMIAIKDSFMTTYNVNDSADYALLYANGFENSFLAATQNGTKATFRIRETDSVLCADYSSNEVFQPSQMKTVRLKDKATVDKWKVRMYFKFQEDASDPTKLSTSQGIKYKIFVLDNYYSPNLKVMSVYEGTIWPPHVSGISGNKIVLKSNGDYTNDEGHKYCEEHYGVKSDGWKDTIYFDPNPTGSST